MSLMHTHNSKRAYAFPCPSYLKKVIEMAQNSIAPGFIKLFYQSSTAAHVATLPVRPFVSAVPPAGYWLEQRGDITGAPWATALAPLVTALRGIAHTSISFQYAELWTVASPGADPFYRDTTQINLAGTSTVAPSLASQIIYSFRTANGGVGRLTLLDGSVTPNTRILPPGFGSAPFKAVADYLTSTQCILVGRDNGFVVAVVKALTKTNDALRRKYGLTI